MVQFPTVLRSEWRRLQNQQRGFPFFLKPAVLCYRVYSIGSVVWRVSPARQSLLWSITLLHRNRERTPTNQLLFLRLWLFGFIGFCRRSHMQVCVATRLDRILNKQFTENFNLKNSFRKVSFQIFDIQRKSDFYRIRMQRQDKRIWIRKETNTWKHRTFFTPFEKLSTFYWDSLVLSSFNIK